MTTSKPKPTPTPSSSSSNTLIAAAEISKHNGSGDLWMVIEGIVYDLTTFAPTHPGGLDVLLLHAGRDGTASYSEVHAPSLIRTTLSKEYTMGRLDEASVPADWHPTAAPSPPPSSTTSSSSSSSSPSSTLTTTKPPLSSLINTHDFAAAAQSSFSRKAWAFASSAATDSLTHARNASTYSHITLRPRVLRDVSQPSLTTTMLGCEIASPVFCAPTSMGRMFHPQGERELARGCRRVGVPQVVSTSCSFPFGEVVDAHEEDLEVEDDDDDDSSGDGEDESGGSKKRRKQAMRVPVFFQLYMDKNRSKSERLLREVVSRGARGVFLTVDAPVIGKREADERVQNDANIRMPMTGVKPKALDKKGGGVGRLMGGFIDSSLTWDEAVPWIRSVVGPKVAIGLKGVQTAADAVKAMEVGCDAVYISNHGGRSLDTSPATILVLLELQRCCPQVFDRMEVFVDGGIWRGTDVFKALCLGAKAVGIGRGFLYGLGYGQEGVEKFVGILNDELQTTMQMCGVTRVDQCHPGLLYTAAIDHLVPEGEEHPYAKWRPKPRL